MTCVLGQKGHGTPHFKRESKLQMVNVDECKRSMYSIEDRMITMSVVVLDAGNSIIKAKIARRENGEISFPHAIEGSRIY
jgi:hypothetical protein